MTQSSSSAPQNVPEKGPARDLKLALRGLHYDLDTELENFRKWRQQNQKSSVPQTPGLVSVPKPESRLRWKLFPNMPELTPLTMGAGALILLSLGSILWFFTHREQGTTTTPSTPARVQPVIPSNPTISNAGSALPSGTQSNPKSVEPQPATPSTQGQPAQKVAPSASKPIAPANPAPTRKKSTDADKPSPFSAFKGYGYYYVFVPVDGAKDLGRLKAMAPGVYPRVIEGRSYMQMAAYDSDRRAQVMARQLRQGGYTVFVVK
jgi:hypothetical protein